MSNLSKLKLTMYPNGSGTFLVDSLSEIKEANYTVIITTDSGKTFVSTLDGIVYTLPSIAIGNTVTFTNLAEDGQAKTSVSPAALDGVTYAGSSTDDKDIINTKSTSRKGDFITLSSLDGVVAWQVVAVRGIWAKES